MNQQNEVRKLASLDDWELEDADQDLRGKTLQTEDGREIGTVEDMLADTDQQRIVALRLTDGRVVNIDAVDLRDGSPVLAGDRPGSAPAPASVPRGEETSQHVPIVEERMRVDTRQVEFGRVRVRSRVVAEKVSEDVSLRDEHVDVERRPLHEAISASEADALFKDSTIEVAETGEQAVVRKEAVVTGEVVVSKDVDTRTERVEDTVRHTEVDVDRDPSPGR